MKIHLEITQPVDTIGDVMAFIRRETTNRRTRVTPTPVDPGTTQPIVADPTVPPVVVPPTDPAPVPDPAPTPAPVPDPPPPPPPPISVDDALKAVIANEATLNADEASVVNIQTAISTATAPLPAAQAVVANDITAYNNAVDVAIVALQKSKRAPAPPPAA